MDGETCTVTTSVVRKSWRAWGSYRERHITGKGVTESAALTAWRKMATFIANE